jgi:pimeloyl-ACP methyl ester carboxylesterase
MGLAIAVLLAAYSFPAAATIPQSIFSDPPVNQAYPARMEVLYVPSGGVKISGLAYLATGPGPHPTIVICHGLPGNEKNLDLAQSLRRAGWNAVTFNYRGSWGSPGAFRFAQNPEDAAAVLAYLRIPEVAKRLRVDRSRLVLAGHSMGGWVTATVASRDRGLRGAILISPANTGATGRRPRDVLLQHMTENMQALAGTSAELMADEAAANADAFDFLPHAPALKNTPLLVLTSDDGLAPQSDALVARIREAGGTSVKTLHVATDHSWSDRRIRLQTEIINWLSGLK